ncbi:MAG: hypothetical protein JSV76_06720 [Candidatus Bathyarchaeota archaeon]|nr:MAG: hypothetical protein JSV76_06720 [Candidatus Bathyarchaeota archaeon]
MSETRKLKTLVLEEHIDAVLRTLIEVGSVQLIDMRERLESVEGMLVPYEVSVEAADRCSSLLSRISTIVSRIDEFVEPTELKTSKTPIQTSSLSRKRSEEELNEVELRLVEFEKKLSSVEERLANIRTQRQTLIDNLEDLKKRQILIDKLKTLTSGLEKTLLEGKLQELTDQIEEEALRGEQSIVKISANLETKTIEMKELVTKEKPMLGNIHTKLLMMEETVRREELVIQAKFQFMRTTRTIYFEAYVSRSHLNEVISRIKEASGGDCLITDERPFPDEKAPTAQILAPSYMIAFEKLTTAAGRPTATEVNPIPIMAITFPLLFGIMFADVGQGAIFIILGGLLTLLKRKAKLEEMGDILRYVFISSELFIFLGISAIFWGFLFGEFFGPSGLLHPISLGNLGPFYFGGFEPTQEPMKMVRFAVLVGVVHLGLGMILRVVNEIKKHHMKHVPVSLGWLWLLFGGFLMWVYWGGISNIAAWFDEGIFMFVGFVLLPLVMIIVSTTLVEGFMEGVGFGVEVFAETLSHTLSYSRLMALGLVHSVMNSLFLVLGGVEHGHFPLLSIPLIAIGTILVMGVEGLIVFIHTLRLHWIEWFSKFYTGEGVLFEPLTMTIKGEE